MTVIVRVIVTRIPDPVTISVLLARVWCPHTVVLGAGHLRAVETDVRPSIIVIVRATEDASSHIARSTLAESARKLK